MGRIRCDGLNLLPRVLPQNLLSCACNHTEEFAVTALAVGVLSSAYFYPYGLMQIPVGYLSDTKGPRLVTTVFTLIAFIGTMLFALSPTFEVAVLGRLLIGVGVSGVYIPTIKIISQWFRVDEFATLTGVLFAVGNIGALVSAYPLAAMVSAFGWRSTFFLIGAITLILALSCWILVRDSPKGVVTDGVNEKHLLYNHTKSYPCTAN